MHTAANEPDISKLQTETLKGGVRTPSFLNSNLKLFFFLHRNSVPPPRNQLFEA